MLPHRGRASVGFGSAGHRLESGPATGGARRFRTDSTPRLARDDLAHVSPYPAVGPRRTPSLRPERHLLVLPILAGLAACGDSGRRQTIDPPRRVADRLRHDVTDADRHGFAAAPAAGSARAPLEWQKPHGWQVGPSNSLRLATFFAPGGVEVSLSTLAGGGGGAQSNIDRWRQQLGLAALTAEEFAALPRRRVLEGDAVLVDVAGRYTGGGTPIDDARLLGLVATAGGNAVFVKLIGPRAAVGGQQTAFDEFAASLRLPARGTSAAAAPGLEPALTPQLEVHGDEVAAGRLRWRVPPGWERGEAAPMRLVTYHPGNDRDVHAYLVILPGEAGGSVANLARWRGQVGLPPLDDAGRAAMPQITMLGAPARLLEAYGESQALFATGARIDGDSVFAKMIGPAAKLRAARAAFVQFCESLRRQ